MGKSASYWREKLKQLRSELEGLDALAQESRSTVELDQSKVGRLSRMDALQGQAMQSAVSGRRARDIALIDRAMQALDDGEFGYCEHCGDEIAPARLEINPLAVTCIACAR